MTYRSIWITAAILQLLHSSGVVGQTNTGLFLSLKGMPIDDGGFVNAGDVGVGDDALLCLTNATNCCAGSNRMGEWYLPNGTVVSSFSDNGNNPNNDFFSRNRDHSVVRLNQYNSPSERGRFSCELLGNTIYVNILTIGPVSGISPATPVTVTAGETVNLQCSVVITPHPLPAGTSTPIFEWFFAQTFSSPLTSTTTNSTSDYSSTLQLTSVSESDEGMYTCRLRGNHRTAVSTTITVVPAPPPPMVSVSITTSGTNTAGASYSLVCSVTVTGSTDTPTITWLDPMNSQVPSEMVSTTGSMNTLTFNPLSASHAGTYTCRATLTSGEMDTNTVMVTVQAPTITVRVDASVATPMAGSTHSLTCTVTGAEKLTGSTITYQWFKDGVMVSGQTMETFSFTPLSFSDAGCYTCQATVTSSLLSGPITTTRSNSVNVTLTSSTPTVSVTSNLTGIITVGSSVTLTCTVVLDPSVDIPVTVNTVWTGPDNFNRNVMAQQMGSTTTYTSTVTVSSFGRDQSGDYTCTATVSSPAQFIVTSISESSSVKITSFPRPTVYLISSTTNPVVSGSLVTLTCTVEFHQPVGVPLTINTVWTGPVGSAITGATYPAVMESLTLYQSSVTTKLNLSGKYTCTANVSGAFEVSASTSIEIVDGMFQLRLKGTDICSQWYNENSNKSGQYSRFIKEAVAEAVTHRCKCQFLVSNLLEDSFSCEESTNVLTYRSTLRGTYNFNGSQITDFIQDWVSSGPRIKIGYDREYVRIDSSCPAAISSLDEPDCGHNTKDGNSGCQTYGDNPESFTKCAQELENNRIATCIDGCVVRNS